MSHRNVPTSVYKTARCHIDDNRIHHLLLESSLQCVYRQQTAVTGEGGGGAPNETDSSDNYTAGYKMWLPAYMKHKV